MRSKRPSGIGRRNETESIELFVKGTTREDANEYRTDCFEKRSVNVMVIKMRLFGIKL